MESNGQSERIAFFKALSNAETALCNAQIQTCRYELEKALKLKKTLSSFVRSYVERQLIIAILQSSKMKLAEDAGFALLRIRYAKKVIETQNIYEVIKNGDSTNVFVSPHMLEKGDILLSYKTTSFLRMNVLASLIAASSGSHITHALLVADVVDEQPMVLVASPGTKGLAVTPFKFEKEEVLLVFRPQCDQETMGKYAKSIDAWVKKAHQRKTDKYFQRIFHFSELKCWLACFSGMWYWSGVTFFGREFIFPNLASYCSGLFCSELIDEIFKEANIYLAPRSRHDSLVGPFEILFSPDLEFRGIICISEDFSLLQKDIH